MPQLTPQLDRVLSILTCAAWLEDVGLPDSAADYPLRLPALCLFLLYLGQPAGWCLQDDATTPGRLNLHAFDGVLDEVLAGDLLETGPPPLDYIPTPASRALLAVHPGPVAAAIRRLELVADRLPFFNAELFHGFSRLLEHWSYGSRLPGAVEFLAIERRPVAQVPLIEQRLAVLAALRAETADWPAVEVT